MIVVDMSTTPETNLFAIFLAFNRHRATVNLINGQKIVTDLSEAYYLRDLPFLVFPNPISGFGTLSIFSKNFDGEVLATGSTAFANAVNAINLHDIEDLGERVSKIIELANAHQAPEIAAMLKEGVAFHGAEGIYTSGGANMLVNL